MKSRLATAGAVLAALAIVAAGDAADKKQLPMSGKPDIQSMSTLEFGPDAILFIGDARGGAVYAVDTGDRTAGDRTERFSVNDIEGKIAAVMGTSADDVLIHDMAVNPISRNTYVSVSRGRSSWESEWYLPNDLADANLLVRITTDGSIEEVKLDNVRYARAALPNPIDPSKKHRWKDDMSLRVDAITDIAYDNGRVYVTGMSNEEFSSALWHMDFPFAGEPEWTTLEIFHGAHGKWETLSPIRAFLPYRFGDQEYVLASYLCTPLVTFPMSDLASKKHVKGHTVAEFGSGNFPLDIVRVKSGDKEFFVMANSQLPLFTFTPESVREYLEKPGITAEPSGYTAGVPYTARAATGVQQLDNFNDQFVVVLKRAPSGKLDLVSLSIDRLAL